MDRLFSVVGNIVMSKIITKTKGEDKMTELIDKISKKTKETLKSDLVKAGHVGRCF